MSSTVTGFSSGNREGKQNKASAATIQLGNINILPRGRGGGGGGGEEVSHSVKPGSNRIKQVNKLHVYIATQSDLL